MKQSYAAFLSWLMAYAILLLLLGFAVRSSFPEKFRYEYAWGLVLFFTVTTAAFHYGLISSSEKGNRNVVRYYMLSTAVKLMLYFLIMVGYSMVRPAETIPFVSNFFVLYILFTVFEVSVSYRHFRSKTSL